MYDLSVLIPARNEMFLAKTVETILANIRGNTEIIVFLDGNWTNPPIQVDDDPRVTIVYSPVSIGQRAGTNQACRLSQAKYVMKIDAHSSVDEGFDVKMIEAMQQAGDDVTMVPMMYNLHAFDWVCAGDSEGKRCAHRIYQGPTPEKCECGSKMEREMIWMPRLHKKSMYYRFDKTLHFQYWGNYGKRPEASGNLAEIMSIQGSCFMLTREKYWELDICDEKHGSWGQQGVEVACKTWFSGGRVLVNKNTWYAHMFRTQGGDFGFPYPLSGSDIDKSRNYSRFLFEEGNWSGKKDGRDLTWLLDKFYPVPGWHDSIDKASGATDTTKGSSKPSKGVIYYSHMEGDETILAACRKQLLKGMKEKHIVSATSEPLQFGRENIYFPRIREAGFLDMFEKILLALEAQTADIIFFAEHDVLYHPSHFDFIPPEKDVYYYNTNVWRIRYSDGLALWVNDLKQLSGMVVYRETAIKHYKERIKKIYESGFTRGMGFEPGTHGREERVDDLKAESYSSHFPNLDIRHETNSTQSRWKKEEYRNQRYTDGWLEADEVPGWGITRNNVPFLLNSI